MSIENGSAGELEYIREIEGGERKKERNQISMLQELTNEHMKK